MNSQGRPKESSGKEEDFQPWVKKMESFFAGVIKESEMTLEWAADQTMEITTAAIDLEFFPESNGGRGVSNLEFVLQHMHRCSGLARVKSTRHCCQLAEEPVGGVATTS